MDDQALLSDLCRICNDATPKYCCPRCNTQTCSLQCYKRHQTWSQCSGKRDPGAYVKRSQLATPAGIDHDFNFLSGIERAFETADRDASGRGIGVETTSTSKRRHNGPTKGSNLQRGLAASGAIIRRAPLGMSRQKANKTGYNGKNRCLVWTVEWVNPDGTKGHGQCRENLPLELLYHNFSPRHRPKKRQKVDEDDTKDGFGDEERAQKSIKIGGTEEEANDDDQVVTGRLDEITETYQRMLEESKARYEAADNPSDALEPIPATTETGSSPPEASNQSQHDTTIPEFKPLLDTETFMSPPPDSNTALPQPITQSPATQPISDTAVGQAPILMEVDTIALSHSDDSELTVPPLEEDSIGSAPLPQQELAVNFTTPPEAEASNAIPQPPQANASNTTPQQPEADTSNNPSQQPQENPMTTFQTQQEPTPPPLPGLHFYLHKPHTTTPLPVLIPLSPTATLSTCLQNRLILEYPTIYVLPQPPSELPDTFLLEEEYHKQEKKMIEELDQDERELGVGILPQGHLAKENGDGDGDVEEARVLESLKRDLMGVAGMMEE